MDKKLRVGILGGTGMVGQRFISLLENHPWFEVVAIAASPRSAGKTYEEAIGGRWKMTTPMPEAVKKIVVQDVSDVDSVASKVDFVFSAVDMTKDEIKKIEEEYAKTETPVVSNNSAHRWTPDVPMVVPELNPEHLEVIADQKKRLGTTRGFIVVKPNCSIQSYTPALHALKKAGYEITDIKDFASLKSVAEDIHKRADKLGFDAFTSSGLDDASAWRFTGHLANMALFYEGRDDGWKEAPAEIKGTYLENFKNVWDLYINNSKYDKNTLATGGYDAEAEFKKGEAVFYQNGTWEYDALKKSISDDDMQMIPIYCGVEGEEKAGLCSGTENCWAVNAKASKADQKATLEFMKWLVTSEEGTKVMAEQFGAIPYKKAADSGNVFLKNANDLLEAGNYNVDWAFNYTPNVDEWRASLVAAMNKYDAGGSWDDVKTAFVQGWATQYKAANK